MQINWRLARRQLTFRNPAGWRPRGVLRLIDFQKTALFGKKPMSCRRSRAPKRIKLVKIGDRRRRHSSEQMEGALTMALSGDDLVLQLPQVRSGFLGALVDVWGDMTPL